MPDEQNPLQRARPAAPAMPPVRGHAPAVRPAFAPKAPGSGRGAPPVIAVRPAKTQQAEAAEPPVAAVIPVARVEAPAVAPLEPPVPALVLEPPGAEVMPPQPASELRQAPGPILAPEAWGTYARPIEPSHGSVQPQEGASAQPLAGLPYFDDAGQPHGAVRSPVAEDSDSQLHAAAVLERIAAGIRAGSLTVDGADASASEPATLAVVLASMLRQQR
jgi:hypothetical protein